MLTLLPKYPNKIFKTFMIEDFFHFTPMSTTTVVHLDTRIQYLGEFSKKFETALLEHSGDYRKLIHEKKPEVVALSV
jgi:hypothetical protein